MLVDGDSYLGPLVVNAGETVLLSAQPAEYYSFDKWSGDISETAAVTELFVENDVECTANFERIIYTLEIVFDGPGKVLVDGETYSVPVELVAGETVILEAYQVSECYRFEQWLGDLTGVDYSQPLFVNRDLFVTVQFAPDFSAGEGTAAAPLEVSDWWELDRVRCFADSAYLLVGNLDEQDSGYVELASSAANAGAGWKPLGDGSNRFTGSFDGAGYTISGLNVVRPAEDYVGLFGYTGAGSSISDLGLINLSVEGDDYTGGLVGRNLGIISRAFVVGQVTGDRRVGGVVGQNDSIIENLYARGIVSGDQGIGGVVGYNFEGMVEKSYAAAEVIGAGLLGGLVGINDFGSVSNSFCDTEVSGLNVSEGGEGLSTAELKEYDRFVAAGWNIEPTGVDRNDGYPYLSGETEPVWYKTLLLTASISGEGNILVDGETYVAPMVVTPG